MEKLTSIVIICHNYGRFLEESINSVVSQTVPAKEIIVVNDASDDETDAVAKKFHDRISYYVVNFHNPQKTRNFGLTKATGKYVALLDADDRYAHNYIEELQSAMEKDQSLSLVYADRYNFGDEAVLQKNNIPRQWKTFDYNYTLLRCASYISICALVRREEFTGFDEQIKRGQDWDAWLTYLKGGKKAKRIPKPLFHVRFHGTNLTFQKNGFSDIMDVYRKHNNRWIIPFLIFGAHCAGAINRFRNAKF